MAGMAHIMRLRGVPQVVAKLKREKGMTGDRIAVGLKTAGLFIQRESQLLCPVEFGFLVNSAFTRSWGSGFETTVQVGYTAEYALYVHEILDNYHKPPTQAKFLEQPAREKKDEIFGIIARAARRK